MSDVPSWLKAVCPDSEMGRTLLEFDWVASPLGDPADWPIALRSAIGICLTSGLPMCVSWGPDHVAIYNDAYRSILGEEKHPAAFGRSSRDVWAEVWDDIGPLHDSVLRTGQPVSDDDLLLLIDREGFLEETHFLSSYGPLFDDAGEVGGVLAVVAEMTGQVISRRRMAHVAHLATELHGVEDLLDVCIRAARALGKAAPDVLGADILLDIAGELTPVVSSAGSTIRDLSRGELRGLERRGIHVVGDAAGGTRPVDRVALRIGGPDRVHGVLVIRTSPHRPLGPPYLSFLRLLADTIDSALQVGYRVTNEIGRYRQISDTLQKAMLEPADDVPTVAARYVPASGHLSVGGDWYDVIELPENRRALVIGDCIGHGLDAAAAMAQLRSVARAGLLDGNDPAAVLESLDLFAERTENAANATAIVMIIDREDGEIIWSRAGHIPPLIVGPDRSTWLEEAGSIPLGTELDTERVNGTHTLHEGELLVLCSDGLVERRGEGLAAGFDRLEATVRSAGSTDPQTVADHLVAELIPQRPLDDVVLIVKCLDLAETR